MLIHIPFILTWFFGFQIVTETPGANFIVEIPGEHLDQFIHQAKPILSFLEQIHPETDLYRATLPENSAVQRLSEFRKSGTITRWQHDRKVVPRNTPNDPMFPNQWDMLRIGMTEAWDQTTGGVTVNGDTIVVAILDTGFDIDHEDLRDNLWKNHAEIPGDGIDNDQNGYVDDYLGVNVRMDNGTHPNDNHGTGVAGIIGARGGNSKGTCGVNWHVKLLLISGIQNESDIIEGYAYTKDLRDKYKASGGAHGAFVVATSLSAGIDNGLPEDHQLWCDQYAALGAAGILGVCATTNSNTDVDVHGDMPTTCPSTYLIAVTNSGMNDQKLLFAGFGAVHIDLAAPGTPSLTTEMGNTYGEFEGTSAAAPHVTGAIALLYSAACEQVLELAQSNPGILAAQMRNLILDNGDQIPGLANITATGSRLNVASAIGAMVELCGSAGGDLEILTIRPNPVFTGAFVEYNIPDLNPYILDVYDSAGRHVWTETPPLSIPGVQLYHLQIPNLIPGVYFLAITHRDKTVSKSILVQ